jgi:iron complex transport system substrate-binding protein
VGVTKHCDAEGVPVVGDMRPSLPKILKQRPDLTLIGDFSFNYGDRKALRAQGLRTLALRLTSLQDLRRTMLLLGHKLQALDAAKRLIKRLDEAMEEAKRRGEARLDPGPSVLLVYGLAAGTVITTGGGDHIAEMVTLLGAKNVAQSKELTRRLSLATVVSLNPDIIVHVTREGGLRDTASALSYWSALPTLGAVKTGAIHVWPDDGLAQLGEHTPGALMGLAKILAPEAP